MTFTAQRDKYFGLQCFGNVDYWDHLYCILYDKFSLLLKSGHISAMILRFFHLCDASLVAQRYTHTHTHMRSSVSSEIVLVKTITKMITVIIIKPLNIIIVINNLNLFCETSTK